MSETKKKKSSRLRKILAIRRLEANNFLRPVLVIIFLAIWFVEGVSSGAQKIVYVYITKLEQAYFCLYFACTIRKILLLPS